MISTSRVSSITLLYERANILFLANPLVITIIEKGQDNFRSVTFGYVSRLGVPYNQKGKVCLTLNFCMAVDWQKLFLR